MIACRGQWCKSVIGLKINTERIWNKLKARQGMVYVTKDIVILLLEANGLKQTQISIEANSGLFYN